MPTYSRFSEIRAAMLAIAVACLLTSATAADAATRIWSGAAGNGLWSDPLNWTGGVVPVAGDDLNGLVGTSTNDLPANTSFNSISMGTVSGQIAGNPIILGAGGLSAFFSVGGGTSVVDLAITLGVSQSWNAGSFLGGGGLDVHGAVHLNGQTLRLTAGRNDGMVISGVIDGTGALISDGPVGSITLSGANTFSGPVTVVSGALRVTSPTALGVADGTLANGTFVPGISANGVPSEIALVNVGIGNEAFSITGFGFGHNALDGSGAVFAYQGPSSIAGPITLTGTEALLSGNALTPAPLTIGGTISGPADLDVKGFVTLLNGLTGTRNVTVVDTIATTVLTLDTHDDAVLTGAVKGSDNLGTIRFIGTNSQTFSAAVNTFNGALIVDHGTVKVIGGSWPAATTVNNDGHFSIASGTVAGAITVNDGFLLLTEGGASHSGTGMLTLDSQAHLDVGTTAPNLMSRLSVTGNITLGNATLTLQSAVGFRPARNTTFTLIDNFTGAPVNGTFQGLPEGTQFTTGGVTYAITYVGGDGNDVVLTVLDGPREYLLSEGATSNFFRTDLLLANPNDQPTPIHITFLKDDGTTVTQDETLAAMSHKSIVVNDVAGMSGTSFSTVVSSTNGLPLSVERTMSWDRSSYGAHTEHATEGTALTWYFAEGSQGFFHTYLLLANPGVTANEASVLYLPEFSPAFSRDFDLTPRSRLTVDMANEPGVLNQSFGMVVTFTQPGAAERAMYFGTTPLFNGGHESAGATAPSDSWFLAEGATGSFFETFLLLVNPSAIDATATLTYLPASGIPLVKTKVVFAHSRLTVNIGTEDPSLQSAAVSTQVTSTQPILVERSQYWPNPASTWYEAHNSFGVTSLGTKWGLAEGRVGNVDGITNAQTFILLANPGTTTAHVTVTFLRDDPATNVTKTFTVDPTSRFNVHVGPGNDVPELNNEHFGALVTSDQPIAVERALYWDANNQIWAAGTGATATKLP